MAQPSLRVKLIALVVSPVLFLALLEAGLRIAGYRYAPRSDYAAQEPFHELSEPRIYVPDPELLWKLRPSTVIDVPDLGFLHVRTNALGVRGEEIPERKPRGEVRVLCLGDSITFGMGLEDGETWPARMGARLRSLPGLRGRTVRVINGAVPGWSSLQCLRFYRRVRRLAPDVVIAWLGANDVKMREVPDREQAPPGGGAGRLAERLRWFRVFQLCEGAARRIAGRPDRYHRVGLEEFRAVAAELSGAGAPPVLFVRCPDQAETTIRELEGMIRAAERMGVDRIAAPYEQLHPYAPVGPGVDLTGERGIWEGRPAIIFGGRRADRYAELSEVRDYLDRLARWKRDLDRYLAVLPPGSPGYRDLFGGEAPARVFSDNCHLRPRGARLAGEALALRIPPLLGE